MALNAFWPKREQRGGTGDGARHAVLGHQEGLEPVVEHVRDQARIDRAGGDLVDDLAAHVAHVANGGHGPVKDGLGQQIGDGRLIVLQQLERHDEVFPDKVDQLGRQRPLKHVALQPLRDLLRLQQVGDLPRAQPGIERRHFGLDRGGQPVGGVLLEFVLHVRRQQRILGNHGKCPSFENGRGWEPTVSRLQDAPGAPWEQCVRGPALVYYMAPLRGELARDAGNG